ncbi:MAG TPA: YggS family pyridoxal phosphate-dependent enzyme [Bacteroidia bacterium]|nr:YggS family pyridoxal phosphate-dependent enzyme [Bacteroidia bacterium]
MDIIKNLQKIKNELPPSVSLIAVSKTYSAEKIKELYNVGQRKFGENKVQEMCEKYAQLPTDIQWHFIGHLQTNKVKYIATFVSLIHSVDSLKLLQEINKQAKKKKRIINCLLQIYIANEDTKFGLTFEEFEKLLIAKELEEMQHIKIVGLMGMATNTNNINQIANEFKTLKLFFEIQKNNFRQNANMQILSMGMSSDYKIAVEQGSNLVRIGSLIFGDRILTK